MPGNPRLRNRRWKSGYESAKGELCEPHYSWTSTLKPTGLSLSLARKTMQPSTLPMKTTSLLAGLVAFAVSLQAETKDPMPLWPVDAPGALGKEEKDVP